MDNQTLICLAYAGTLFFFGLAAGSFLNVVIYRMPLGLSVVDPPSSCPSCGRRILARDNLPLVGWLFLGGKCRFCRNPISWRYPGVELLTGLLWAAEGVRLSGMHHGLPTGAGIGLIDLLFISAMIVTIFVDYDYQIILDETSLGGATVGLIASALLPVMHFADSPEAFYRHNPELFHSLGHLPPWFQSVTAALIGGFFGFVISYALYLGGNILFRKQIEKAQAIDPDIDSAIGFGDVKLMGCIGVFQGWRGVLIGFVAACVAAALIGSIMKLVSGQSHPDGGLKSLGTRWESGVSVLPFGPFLAGTALLFLFFRHSILFCV